MYHNKVNNALVFPHLMRVVLDMRIKKISLNLLLLTSKAIAKTVTDRELDYEHIIPEIMNKRLQKNITLALSKFASK